MIFPKIKNKKIGYINLNEEAQIQAKEKGTNPSLKNKLIDPKFSQKLIDHIHKKYSIDISYGGWMEDRSFLLRDWYLDKTNNFIHLGVDINAPYGTKIAINNNAKVIAVEDDYPLDGGWGKHIILKIKEQNVYLLFAHLDKIKFKVGQNIKNGEIFASIGKPPFNGNWWKHLHIQAIEKDYFYYLKRGNLWKEFDGYGSRDKIKIDAKRHPDPMQFIKII